ncbi:MAG: peptidoglycan D,D-transpeptidase FtsI family protein [Planctomycetota bacterium]|jgi:cell division protein FtsI (penicillin-binding protein 3)
MRNVRLTIVFSLLLILSFLALGGRCLYLQSVRNDHYVEACLKQQRAYRRRQPQRGVILDGRGRVLAASNKIQIIKAEPRIIDDPKEVSSELAPIIDMGAHVICKLIMDRKDSGHVSIKTGADPCECSLAGRVHRGIGVESSWQRHYPMGRLVANVVGFTDPYGRGLEGIELKYDEALSGSAARNIFFVDKRRRPILPKEQEGVMYNGVGIILTIDSTIQQFVRDELVKQCRSYEAESAVAIVAEPRTGAILAMVSLPDFDPADVRTTDPNDFRSRAITDWFEPGSVLKPIVTAIALDAGVVNKSEKIFCENGDYHGKGFGRFGEYEDGFGNLTVRDILIKSSNIGMAKIGQRLGKKRLYDGLKFFGFGDKTGIELPGEVAGLLRGPQKWDGYSVTRIPFGQEICVTAMQLVRGFCILANGGRLVRPFLVRAIVDSNGKITELKRQPPAVGYIIRPEVAKWVVGEAMVGVVNEGTGERAQLEEWQVFGKTGTAQMAKSDSRGYSNRDYIASFAAGAPAEDPAIVVLVSIRKPNRSLGKGYTGGPVASPVAKNIIRNTLNYLGVEHSKLKTSQTKLALR